MILLDTNILLYAVGGDHPLRGPCARLLRAHGTGTVVAAMTEHVVQEFIHVFSRRRDRPSAVTAIRGYLEAMPMITAAASDIEIGLDIYERHDRVGAVDSILAGITLGAGLDALVSADRAFAAVPGLPWVAPGTPAFDALLTAGTEPASR